MIDQDLRAKFVAYVDQAVPAAQRAERIQEFDTRPALRAYLARVLPRIIGETEIETDLAAVRGQNRR